uniref:Fibronectin type-III domain-containing protein n=1 Tax=viral metagenome TaxID=1070528 RepID=A0A6C0IDY2_9ZZZZ
MALPPNYNSPLTEDYLSKTLGSNTVPLLSDYPSLGQNTVPLRSDYPIQGFVPPPPAPGIPTINSVTKGNGQVTILFTPAEGDHESTTYTATVYPDLKKISPTENDPTTILVTGLTNGTSYNFTVTAKNRGGEITSEIFLNVIPAAVPSAPRNVVATRGNTSVSVSFTAPDSNGGSPITEYTVTSNQGNTGKGSSSPITISDLTNGTSYTFTVTAKNNEGSSPPSTASIVVIPATTPSAPTSVSIIEGDNEVTIRYSPPSNNGGSPITGYTVTSVPVKTITVPAISVANPSPDIRVTGLTNGTKYTFTIRAINEVGPGAPHTIEGTPVAPPPPVRFYTTNLKVRLPTLTPGAYFDNNFDGTEQQVFLDNYKFANTSYYLTPSTPAKTYHGINDQGFLFIRSKDNTPHYITDTITDGNLTFKDRKNKNVPYKSSDNGAFQMVCPIVGTARTITSLVPITITTNLISYRELRFYLVNNWKATKIGNVIPTGKGADPFFSVNFFRFPEQIYFDNFANYDTIPTSPTLTTLPTDITPTNKTNLYILDSDQKPHYFFWDNTGVINVFKTKYTSAPYDFTGNVDYTYKIKLNIITTPSNININSTFLTEPVNFLKLRPDPTLESKMNLYRDPTPSTSRYVLPTHLYGLNLKVKAIDLILPDGKHCDLSTGNSGISNCPKYTKNTQRIKLNADGTIGRGAPITTTAAVQDAIDADQPLIDKYESSNLNEDKTCLNNTKTGSISAANFGGEVFFKNPTGLTPGTTLTNKTNLVIRHTTSNKYFNIDPVTNIQTINFKNPSNQNVKLNYIYNNIWKISNTNNTQVRYVMLYKESDNSKKAIKISDEIKTIDVGNGVTPFTMDGDSTTGGFNKTRKKYKI